MAVKVAIYGQDQDYYHKWERRKQREFATSKRLYINWETAKVQAELYELALRRAYYAVSEEVQEGMCKKMNQSD